MERYFERHLALKVSRHLTLLKEYEKARRNPAKRGEDVAAVYCDLSDCQSNLTGFLEGVFIFQGRGYPTIDADEHKHVMDAIDWWFMHGLAEGIAKEEEYLAQLREESK